MTISPGAGLLLLLLLLLLFEILILTMAHKPIKEVN